IEHLAVRAEVDAPMHHELEMRIEIGEASGIGMQLQELAGEQQHPAGSASEAADILIERQPRQSISMLLPIGIERQTPGREGEGRHPARHFVEGNAAEVAVIDAGRRLAEHGAAAQHEILATEEPALGTMSDMMDEQVEDGGGI